MGMAKKVEKEKESKERQGKPVVGLTLSPQEVELVDAFQAARAIATRSKALHELVKYAFGHNGNGHSVIDELPKMPHLTQHFKAAKSLHKEVLDAYQRGVL
jgi:hypothetical protein